MTRDDISDLVTKTVGQTDATSLALCNTFVQRAYEMVWNAALWRDSVTIDTSGGVVAGTNTFAMPSGFDRIVSIQLLFGGVPVGFLDPTTTAFILQTEPLALTVQGVPTKYEEFVHTDGTRKVRVFPLPNATYTFTMSAKRTCPTLSGSSTLQIRNVDNAVIALATADMYTRLRQLGKAAEMAKKAGAFLEEAKAIENTQSNLPRTAKNLTVAGNSLSEMADAVCARCGQYSPDAVILAKEFLRRNYQMIYDRYNWSEATVVANVASAAQEIILPVYFDRVLAIRADANLGQLEIAQPSLYFGIAPAIFEQTGTPVAFSYLTPVAVAVLPTQNERLSLVSSSSADTSDVFIMGESSGIEVSETVTLNGTTPVISANTFDTPLTIAKSLTTGTLTVKGYTSATTFVTILASERERKHIRLWLQPAPSASYVCLVLGKRRIKPLVRDEDTPLLRDIQWALITASTADMFAKLGNDKGAMDFRAQSETAIKSLVELETQQGAFSATVVPDFSGTCGLNDYDDSWLVAKG
jgi:hypothetical protein